MGLFLNLYTVVIDREPSRVKAEPEPADALTEIDINSREPINEKTALQLAAAVKNTPK